MGTFTIEPFRPLDRAQKSLQQSKNLPSILAETLAKRIASGALKPGQKLPPETQVMAEHGVGRNVVREAISQLQTRGLIITRHGIGSFVSNNPDLTLHPGSSASLEDVLAVIELRISIEVEAAGFASQRRDMQDLACMQNALNILADPTVSRDVAVAADQEFHRQIALATKNRYFVDITEHLGVALIPRKHLNSAVLNGIDRAEYGRRLHREHEAIYQGIANGDPGTAKAAMHLHLRASVPFPSTSSHDDFLDHN